MSKDTKDTKVNKKILYIGMASLIVSILLLLAALGFFDAPKKPKMEVLSGGGNVVITTSSTGYWEVGIVNHGGKADWVRLNVKFPNAIDPQYNHPNNIEDPPPDNRKNEYNDGFIYEWYNIAKGQHIFFRIYLTAYHTDYLTTSVEISTENGVFHRNP